MAPSPTALDLHWRLFGIDFRVNPTFWILNLVFGYLYVEHLGGADRHLLAYLGLWLLCAFVSILIHELGHVISGRVFGVSSNIILYSMGGLAIGNFERLHRWQRIIVSAAGPAFGLALFAFVEYALPSIAFSAYPSLAANRWFNVLFNRIRLFEGGAAIGLPGMLIIMNLIWNLFNLIPIIPLDGGMIMRETVCGILPRHGMRLAYGFSFLLAGLIAAYSAIVYFRPGMNLPYPPIDPIFSAIMFGMMAFGSFATMRSLPSSSPPRRYHDYEEKDW